jgi:hypothetical protein
VRFLPRRSAIRAVVLAAALAAVTSVAVPATAGSSGLPFKDPAADGYIGLCDLTGHNVTSGSVDSTPFVWKVVSSVEPPAAYRGRGRDAALDIYQVRRNVLPGDWTGQNLIPSTQYAVKKEPTAVATYKDYPLRVVTVELPPMFDGLYVLRMQFGKSGYGIYGATYPMTVIQVTGDKWRVVSGGLVNCARAKGVSIETTNGVAQQLPAKPIKGETPTSAPSAARATTGAAPTPAVTSSGNPTGLTKTVADPISQSLTIAHHSAGVSKVFIIILVILGFVVAALGGLALGRRRPTAP